MFGNPQKKPAVRKPGEKGEPLKKKVSYDPNDMSVEGNLKRLLDEQAEQDELKPASASNESNGDFDAPLIRLVNSILSGSVKMNASDIHIEPFEGLLRVRFRIDGVLQEVHKIPHKLTAPIISRLKIMADLDICEKRVPQDGCIKYRSGEMQADFRMSTLPSVFGEKVVMRVMGTASVNNNLSKLNIPEKQLQIIRSAIVKPDGLVLVTGPTGSGKTTTLYAALNELNDISVSVFTAEDPVEGSLAGVTQCQVNTAVGYTFAAILRSLLRQDPDVILVGEIRDQETAEISIKAALTGHLVLSTLHTNCAISTISRLLNMGIAPYLIASSINCIVAQRLVRRVCEDCKYSRPAPPELFEQLGKEESAFQGRSLWYGKGCSKCNGSGYKGRCPLYEVLQLSDNLRSLILAGSSREEMRSLARQEGMITLRESGLSLVEQGITTLEEVLGATNEDSELQAVPVKQQMAVQYVTAHNVPPMNTVAVQNQIVAQQPQTTIIQADDMSMAQTQPAQTAQAIPVQTAASNESPNGGSDGGVPKWRRSRPESAGI